MTSPESALADALRELLATGRGYIAGAPALSAHQLAHLLIESSVVSRLNTIANEAALANGYAVRLDGEDLIGGRDLTINLLMNLGITEALVTNAQMDESSVVSQLIGLLSGPDVSHLDLVGLDANLTLTAPVSLGEWELFVADESYLESLLPIPALSHFQPLQAWPPNTWAGMAMLRRTLQEKATGQARLWFPQAYPEWEIWKPLTVLALAQPDVVTMWSRHLVEPGRQISELINRVSYDLRSSVVLPTDPDDLFEVPSRNSCWIDASNETLFRARIIGISGLMPRDLSQHAPKSERERFKRMRLAAQRLLAAGKETMVMASPWDPVHATDALLHYVIALEALLARDSDQGDITRKIRQRAAVIVGQSDEESIFIDAKLAKAYTLRSRILHGAEDPTPSDLTTLRAIVRRVMVARLMSEPMLQQGVTFEQLCDRALLSHGDRASLQEPLSQFGDLTLPHGSNHAT